MKPLIPSLTFVVGLLGGPHVCGQSLTRISVSSSQVQGNGASYSAAMSADGHHIAFYSIASNLVSGDTAVPDVFDYDTRTGATVLVSVPSGGGIANGPSDSPSVSASGRYIAFQSYASNLVLNDTNGQYDVFLRDTRTQTTTRVSLDSNGNQAYGACGGASLSADGHYVAFFSGGPLAPNDINAAQDIYVRDIQAGTTVLVSVGVSGNAGNANSAYCSISADGRFVAFMSEATDIVAGDTNGTPDIFVRDTQSGATAAVTVDPNWLIGNAGSYYPSISANGRYVAFESYANNLVMGDANGMADIFVRDMQTLAFTRVSVDSSGLEASAGSFASALSSTGRFVAFISNASNLVSGDANGTLDVFVHDTQGGTTTRVNAVAAEGNQPSYGPSISSDGSRVAFWSDASNLVANDTNGAGDVLLYDSVPCGGYAMYCSPKVNSQGCLPSMCASGVPSYSGSDNFHIEGHHVLNNKTGILLWSYSQGNHPLGGGTLCVGSPFRRTLGQNSGGTPGVNDCTGLYSFYFSQSYMASKGILPGAVIYAQYWSRDPFFPPRNNIGLTDGIEFTVQP